MKKKKSAINKLDHFENFSIRPVKINVFFLIRKKIKKGEGVVDCSFFNTEKMTLDCAYNEQTENCIKI